MSNNLNTAEENLEFMRAIVDEMAPGYRKLGINYGWAGLLYGGQCMANFAMLISGSDFSQLAWLAVGILPTVIFLIINFYYAWQDRAAPFGHGAAKKAINAAFAGVGLATLLLGAVFGLIAYQRQDWTIWFLFPLVVCAMQGAVWFTITIIRKLAWVAFTCLGWFVGAIVLAFLTHDPIWYVFTVGVILLLCMALPGFIMMRANDQPTH